MSDYELIADVDDEVLEPKTNRQFFSMDIETGEVFEDKSCPICGEQAYCGCWDVIGP